MNALPNKLVSLDERKKKFITQAVNTEFRNNPILVNDIDRRLSMMAQSVANMADPATYTTGPHGTVTMSREYELTDTAAIPGGANIDFTEVRDNPGSYIFQCFRQVANVVDSWAPNGRNRLEVYRAVLDSIEETVNSKITDYNTKETELSTAISSTLSSAKTLRNSLSTNTSNLEAYLAAATPPLAPFSPALIAARDELLAILDLNKDKLTGVNPVVAGLVITNTTDIDLLNTQINTRFTNYRAQLSTSGYPANNGGTPPISTGLSEIIGADITTVTNSLTEYSDKIENNLTDHNGNPLIGANIEEQMARFNAHRKILNDYVTSLNEPVEEQLLSEDERHAQVHIEAAAGGMGAAGQPWTIRNPILSPVPGTPTTPGPELSLDEYASYYNWANKNATKLTPEQKEAIDENSSYFVTSRFDTQMNSIHAHLRTLAGGVNATPPTILNNAEQAINDLINNAVPGVIFSGPNEVNLVLGALAYHYKLDTKNTTGEMRSAVIEKLKNETIARFNLPSDEEQKEILEENKKAYASVEASKSIWKSLTQKNRTRRNYLGSQQTTLYNSLKKYSKEDLAKPATIVAIKAEMISGMMNNRLAAINEIAEAEKHTFTTKLKGVISRIPGASIGINLGLIGVSMAAGAMLNPALFAPGVNSTVNFAQSAWGGLKGFVALQGGIGTTLLKGVGIGAAGALGYRLWNGLGGTLQNSSPWSSARSRSQEKVLGSRDTMGNTHGGVGNINRTAATMANVYDNRAVQTALASQIRLGLEKKAEFATVDAAKLSLVKDDNDEKFKGKFNASSYLWEREKQGMSAMIDKEVQNVLSSTAGNKSETLISNCLSTFYGPNGTEERFLKAIERSRSNSQYLSGFKFATSAVAGAGLGSMFAVTF
jgi:hypothetical protein